MGFFSSRKAEDNDNYQVAIGVGGAGNEKSSVVQVIRSRFYGRKGKEREDPQISFLTGVSAAQTLSAHVPVQSSPLSTPHRAPRPTTPHKYGERPLPSIPTPSKTRTNDRPPLQEISPVSPQPSEPSPHSKTHSIDSTSTSQRKNTDNVTVTLAQRLNELALANSEGLLNDDEYRILRQNLFERFASNAAVPSEAPVVPVAAAQPRPKKPGATPDRPTSRPLSNFQVDARPTSVHSKTSAVSGVTNLFRRATGRRSTTKDISDTASVWSTTSNTSFFRLPRALSKKSSSSSVRTNTSRVQPDTLSISSRRLGSDRAYSESHSPIKSTSRSVSGSIRRMQTPPSSFPGARGAGHETRTTTSIYNVFDDEHLTTAKRLMDAFSGLEVTTLAKAQRHHVRPSLRSADFGKGSNVESHWGQDSDGRSQRRITLADDSISMRSGTSAGTAPSVTVSMARSAYSNKKITRTKLSPLISPTSALNNSRPGSLHRKNSSSSVTSAPPVPPLPNSISHGHLKAANSSNVSLVRSTNHLPMNTVPEDGNLSMTGTTNTIRLDPEDVETEMEDIRRRREEVRQRYDARLEYLRAKLKGAQLHEKLMRK
ncbi:hypothetical protein M413DRAFT_18374 [Hebeloma cylindrosporum]|uniref:Uncharacterized protein n=1 Tax=Hebeloma cylindrosporum TaxID=76867 RepID=A0A0C3CGL5_HEBCY|nr:hypothetical protein M413DRAFT_18374 [Hebeloma cylindrosporum h7]